MKYIADLHLHSKYSRAVSPEMVLPKMAEWARRKGIDLLGTGDFTHPLWFREVKAIVEEAGEGIYKLKGQKTPRFIFTVEVSSIYTQGGKLRRIHNLILASSLEEALKIGSELGKRGNVLSDGRPIFGLSAQELADLVLSVSPLALIIPAHIWTPHFSLYGSMSGFDSIEECFGGLSKYIYGIETGLSSSPAMNWRIADLEKRTILSFSDAHSGAKLGREVTAFELEEPSFGNIRKAITQETDNRIAYTIEFYPEEGKYHYTGHRNCGVRQSPEETRRLGSNCSVCGKGLTVGVMHRVEQLAICEVSTKGGSAAGGKSQKLKVKSNEFGVKWIGYEDRPPYAMLVPLLEILAESFNSTTGGQKVINEYKNLTDKLGGEFNVLLKVETREIAKISGPKVAEGIKKVRSGEIVVEPGYDGLFGKVKIWPFAKSDLAQGKPLEDKEQMALF